METVSCNLCQSSRQELLWRGEDWGYGGPGTFSMVRCTDCALIYLNPRPTLEEMANYYPDDYEPYQRTISAFSSRLRNLVRRMKLWPRIRVVTRLVSAGRLLDVGCASGGFLHELSRLGEWQVQGVEINAKAADFARQQLGLDIFCGSLLEAQYPSDCFDVVTMWDVLEHVHDPLTTLKEVYRVLKPGGSFICSTPSADSLDSRIFGRYWIGVDFPRHLYVFSPSSLGAMLQKAGLELQRSFCFYGRYTTFALSLRLWFNAHIPGQMWQRHLRRILFFPVFRYVTLPYFWTLDVLGRGAIVTAHARKSA